MLYTIVKYVHIVLAIVALGYNASYGVLLARGTRAKSREILLYTLRTIQVLDDYFANPAYLLLLLSGLGMAHLGRIPLRSHWLGISLGCFALLGVLGFGVYTPTLRRQIAALERDGEDSPAYRALAARSKTVGIVLFVLAFVVLAMMVFKPHWG